MMNFIFLQDEPFWLGKSGSRVPGWNIWLEEKMSIPSYHGLISYGYNKFGFNALGVKSHGILIGKFSKNSVFYFSPILTQNDFFHY